MKKTQQKVLSGLTVVIFILILTKSETAGFTVNGVEISSNRTCSSNPNITCFVYFIRNQGCSAKAVTAFPHLYDVSKENKFPEKPQSMVINPFHRKYPTNHKYYPGLTITLKAPVTEKKQRVRAQNWTAEEEIALIENVKERSLTLFGPIKGSGMKGKIKNIREKEWSCIADRLNSMFDTKRRGLDEIKKKYYNIKSRSKEKLDGVKRPKTGGGPPLQPLTLGEETFLRLSDGEPNIHGLEGGVDTDAPVQCQSSSTAEMSCLSEQSTSEAVAEKLENLDKENAKAVEEISIHVPEHSGCKKKKHNKKEKESQRRCLEELERENITLDNQRLQDEIAKIRVEREVLVLKKEVLTLQKQKLVFEIQTSFPCLVEQLSSLPEC